MKNPIIVAIIVIIVTVFVYQYFDKRRTSMKYNAQFMVNILRHELWLIDRYLQKPVENDHEFREKLSDRREKIIECLKTFAGCTSQQSINVETLQCVN